jgi:predicted nucleic acid-binding protein
MSISRAVIDASVLIPLLNTGEAALLANLYGEIHIPQKVIEECEPRRRGRHSIRNLLRRIPAFIECQSFHPFFYDILRGKRGIDPGEHETIAQAKHRSINARIVLLNDQDAIRIASNYDLEIHTLPMVRARIRAWNQA